MSKVEMPGCARGFYLREDARPVYPSEWIEEAVLRFEAGKLDEALFCLGVSNARCAANHDYAQRNRARS